MCAARQGRAADTQPEPFYLGEVVIEADYTDHDVEEIMDRPINTTVIRREDFENRFTSLPEVLSEQAGVEIKTYGGFGSYSTVSIRGVSSDKVLVMLDGIPLNLGLGGAVNIGDLPLKTLERIEVYKGHVPAEFGTNAIGGVVNLVTRKGGGKTGGGLSLSAGDYDTREFNLFTSSSAKDLDLAVSLTRRESDGDFDYLNDMGTPYNSSDDSRISRKNNWFRDTHAVLNAEYAVDRNRRLIFGQRWSYKNQGVPGPANSPSLFANLKTLNTVMNLKYKNREGLGPDTETGVDLQLHKYESRFNDTYTNSGEIGLNRQDNRNTTTSTSLTGHFNTYIGANHEIYGSLSRTREHYQPTDRMKEIEVGMPSTRTAWTTRLEYRFRSGSDRLLATAAVGRQDVKSTFPGDDPDTSWLLQPDQTDKQKLDDYHLGLRLRISERLTMKANAGKYYRLPGFYELFGDRGSVVGNTDLRPENGENLDIGLSLTAGPSKNNVTFDFTYFDQNIDDIIVFVEKTRTVFYATNLKNASIRGTEASLNWKISPSWRFNANHTWKDTENGGDPPSDSGKKLPGQYEDTWNFKLQWNIAGFEIYNSLELARNAYLDSANFNELDDRDIYNAGLSYSVGDWVLSVDVKNINDNVISDVIGYPLPGRSTYFTVKRTF